MKFSMVGASEAQPALWIPEQKENCSMVLQDTLLLPVRLLGVDEGMTRLRVSQPQEQKQQTAVLMMSRGLESYKNTVHNFSTFQ